MTHSLRTLWVALCTAVSVTATAAQPAPHTVRIDSQRNERWWGCNPDGYTPQPLAAQQDGTTFAVADSTEFLVSSTGRYLWCAHPFTVAIDDQGTLSVTSDYETVAVTKGGRTLREAYLYCVHKHLHPDVAEARALPFATPLYDAGTPPKLTDTPARGTLLLPDGWQTMRTIPDSVLLTVTPYIPAAGWEYASLRQADELLLGPDGHPLIFHLPDGYFACLDISNKAVMNAFAERLSAVLPTGRGIMLWFDCGQILLNMNDREHRRAFARNWHALAEQFGAVIRRSAYGTPPQWQPFAVAPADLSSETMRQVVARMLNLGLTGRIYPFMTFADTNECTQDEAALLRATQLAAFLPLSVLPTDPARFEKAAHRRAMQRTLDTRAALNGYVEELLHESLVTREPVIRLMEYQFPGQGFADCTDQFMLGPDCLVAPLFDAAPYRLVRLPRGTWTAADGTRYRGPRVIRIDVSDGVMPVFTKQ